MAATDDTEAYDDSMTADDISLGYSVGKENGFSLKASSPQPFSEAATDHNENSGGLSNGHCSENGYSENGHQSKDNDLDLRDSKSFSGIKTLSSLELHFAEPESAVKESYTTLSNGGSSDYHLSNLSAYSSKKKQEKNGDGDTFDYDLRAAAASRSSVITTTSSSNSRREVSDSDNIPALYDRSYIDDIIKRALNPTASPSPPPTSRAGASGLADDSYVTKSHHQHRHLLDVAGTLSDDDLEPHHHQGYQDGAGAKAKVRAVGKYDAYDYSSPISSPRSSRRRLQGATGEAGGGELNYYDKYYKDSRLEKRGTNSYYMDGAGSSRFDYETDYAGYGGYKTTHRGGASHSCRNRGDVNVKYFDPDSDSIYTGEDFEAGAQAEQEQEPTLPDEDFLPQKRPETDDIVKEKTVGARIIVNQQSNVIEKLKNTSKSLDELNEDLRELQQMFLDVQLRHARVCDRDLDENEEGGPLQQYALPRRARLLNGLDESDHGYDEALGAATSSPSLRRRRLQGSGQEGGSELDSDSLLTGGSLSHLAGYRFKPRDSEYFDVGYTPSNGSPHRYDSLLAPIHHDRYAFRGSSENLYGIQGSNENLYGIDEGSNDGYSRHRAVSPRRVQHGDGKEEIEGGYYDSGNPSYYCTLRNSKTLGLAGYIGAAASSYRPKSAAVLTVNTPVLDALSSGKTYHHLATSVGRKSYGLPTRSIGLRGSAHFRSEVGSTGVGSMKVKDDHDGEFHSKFLRKVRQKKAAGETVLPSGEKKSRFLKK